MWSALFDLIPSFNLYAGINDSFGRFLVTRWKSMRKTSTACLRENLLIWSLRIGGSGNGKRCGGGGI